MIAQFQNLGGSNGGQVVDIVFVNDTIYTLTNATLQYSLDDAASWQLVPGSNNLPAELTNMAIDNGVIYLSANHRNIIYKSEDFGQSWEQINDDGFYAQGNIKDFESHNDTLYIYSTTQVFISTDRGDTFMEIDMLNQSFPFLLVHNRILHFENYHYYLTQDRKLVRTDDFINLEEIFDLNSNYYYRLYRNESTLFLMEVDGPFKTIYKLENDQIVIYKEDLNLTHNNLNDSSPLSYDGDLVFEKYSQKYSTDGWFSTNYIMLQDNPNSTWGTRLITYHNGAAYYNWENLLFKQQVADTSRVDITNNMIGRKNSAIYKSGSKIISGSKPISYYDVNKQSWDSLHNSSDDIFLLSNNLTLNLNKNIPRDSIIITTEDGQLFKKSKLPATHSGFNDGIYGINDLIFFTDLNDSFYVSNNYGENWSAIEGKTGVGRLSANYSNNTILVSPSYGADWYVSNDGIDYTYYDLNGGNTYISIDQNDNVYYQRNEELHRYNTSSGTVDTIPMPFDFDNFFSSNTFCFEFYENILFVGGTGEGLFFSFDSGQTWKSFNEGLETKNITSIEIDDEFIYVGTFGHVYKRPLDDISALNIFGFVFEDLNENGTKEPNEKLLSNIPVTTIVNNIIVPTDNQGRFSIITDDLVENKIEIIPPKYSTPTNGPFLLETIQDTLKLGLVFDQEINDVSVKLLSPFVFRPGFTNQVDVYMENLSYNDRMINLYLTLDDRVAFVNSSYAPFDINGNEVTYDDILLNGRGQKLITLTLETEVNAIIGELVDLVANIELKSFPDNDPSNNSHVLSDTIRGSYDPNDKAVMPNEDIVYDENVLDKELIYTIRFQNTGNYPADFVILQDTFENNLDPSSIDIMSYSHPCEWQIKEGRVLEVKFPNINLPNSTVSEELSQGYVTFKLGVNSDISIGTTISNKASIYFDYNPPIITETVVSEIVDPAELDVDNDGYPQSEDCDDNNPNINPDQTEEPYNGIDDDCNPSTLDDDLDQDGFILAEDCDDNNPNINPDQTEEPYNGVDDDCNSTTLDDDLDQDGFLLADDCDDNNPNINPDQTEVPYNGVDDDCKSTTFDNDLDQDGYLLADDCDDNNPDINPDQTEEPYNGVDDDCNTATLDDDLDQDGFELADDCDDNNPNINPDAEEIPNNGIDEDCDGMDLVSSIYEIGNSIINIFPNPTIDEINISIEGNLSFEANLFDLNGKQVISKENSNKICVSTLSTGTYLLEIKDQRTGHKIVEKVIIGK